MANKWENQVGPITPLGGRTAQARMAYEVSKDGKHYGIAVGFEPGGPVDVTPHPIIGDDGGSYYTIDNGGNVTIMKDWLPEVWDGYVWRGRTEYFNTMQSLDVFGDESEGWYTDDK